MPPIIPKISENVYIIIHACQKHALKFTGKMFAFDQQEWDIKPCAKINITFINDDQIRHQLMIHGLPGYLYPEGMFHLELYGEGQLQASLIMPSQKKTYLVHCELPQHMEKGMKAQIKVDGGDGDLPSIPGISKPVRADVYPVDWSQLTHLSDEYGISRTFIYSLANSIKKIGQFLFKEATLTTHASSLREHAIQTMLSLRLEGRSHVGRNKTV